MSKLQQNVLIVEPNEKLTHPYNSLPSTYHTTRVSTITEAIDFVSETLPQIVYLSASFDIADSIEFLEKLRTATHTRLPQLRFVVDFSNQINTIPGTNWGGSVSIIY